SKAIIAVTTAQITGCNESAFTRTPRRRVVRRIHTLGPTGPRTDRGARRSEAQDRRSPSRNRCTSRFRRGWLPRVSTQERPVHVREHADGANPFTVARPVRGLPLSERRQAG